MNDEARLVPGEVIEYGDINDLMYASELVTAVKQATEGQALGLLLKYRMQVRQKMQAELDSRKDQ